MKSRNSISFFACFMSAIMLISALSGLSMAVGTEAQASEYQVIQMDDVTVASQKTNTKYFEEQEEETVDPETIVSIIVQLEDEAVLETYGTLERLQSGYQTLTTKGGDIQEALKAKQRDVAASIEGNFGVDVDFEYQYTLAYNGFAFKGPYGIIDKIKGLEGVKSAQASTIYDVPRTTKGEVDTKNYEAINMVMRLMLGKQGTQVKECLSQSSTQVWIQTMKLSRQHPKR